jgi:hypothetical protein
VRELRSELHALARKYRALCDLRRGVLAPEPAVLRALAREFPGALRELECLPLEALDARLDATLGASAGGDVEEWIFWMLAYHRRMRVVLAVKRRLGALALHGGERSLAVVEQVWLELGERCEPELVAAIARPPAGRLNRLVFELLEQELARPRGELEAILFPELTSLRVRSPVAERS